VARGSNICGKTVVSKLLITLIIGIAAGLVDIAPMLLRRADPYLQASVFMHWFVTTIFISYSAMPLHPVATGALIGGLSTVPILITYAQSHPERLLSIFAIALVLGGAVGFLTHRFAS
jgi:FtsH-binding integral membrane protein